MKACLAGLVLLAGVAGAQAAVQAVDDDGRRVELPAPATRIVSLAPHLTELLWSAGAGRRVVGAVAYSDWPEAARQVARVGDSAQLDLERIVALRPDLVVVWRHGNSPAQIAQLRALGLPLYASEAPRLDDIAGTLRRLGRLAGTDEAAETAAQAFERRVADLAARYAGRTPLTVFYQVWSRPLLTVSGHHLISQVLALCGARNVFAGLAPLVPAVSEEAVVEADPDAIAGARLEGSGDAFAAWRRLTALRAVRRGHFVTTDPDTLHRQSVRIVEGAEGLCRKLDDVRADLKLGR